MAGLGGRTHNRYGLVADITALRLRGLTMSQAAARLGISRATAFRVLKEHSSEGDRA